MDKLGYSPKMPTVLNDFTKGNQQMYLTAEQYPMFNPTYYALTQKNYSVQQDPVSQEPEQPQGPPPMSVIQHAANIAAYNQFLTTFNQLLGSYTKQPQSDILADNIQIFKNEVRINQTKDNVFPKIMWWERSSLFNLLAHKSGNYQLAIKV